MINAILAAGSLGMGIAGAMRKQPQYGYSKGDLEYFAAQRGREIDTFARDLMASRGRFRNDLTNFTNNTFGRFAQNSAPNSLVNGLSLNGGAFQSALARRAAELQDSEMLTLANMERDDINSVENQRASLFASKMGGSPSGPSPDAASRALGQLSSGLGTMAFNGFMADKYLKPSNTNMGTQVPIAWPGPSAFSDGSFQQPQIRRSVFSKPRGGLNLDIGG